VQLSVDTFASASKRSNSTLSASTAKTTGAPTSTSSLAPLSVRLALKSTSKPSHHSRAISSLYSKTLGTISSSIACKTEVISASLSSFAITEKSARQSPKSTIRPQLSTTDASCAQHPKNWTSLMHLPPRTPRSLQPKPLTRLEPSSQKRTRSIRFQRRLAKLHRRPKLASCLYGVAQKLWLRKTLMLLPQHLRKASSKPFLKKSLKASEVVEVKIYWAKGGVMMFDLGYG